nr:hypothetical protein CFP56_24019 [Quercus suber]
MPRPQTDDSKTGDEQEQITMTKTMMEMTRCEVQFANEMQQQHVFLRAIFSLPNPENSVVMLHSPVRLAESGSSYL